MRMFVTKSWSSSISIRKPFAINKSHNSVYNMCDMLNVDSGKIEVL